MEKTTDTTRNLRGRYHEDTITRFEHARTAAGYVQKVRPQEAFLNALLDQHASARLTLTVEMFYEALALNADEQASVHALLTSTGMDMAGFLRRLLLKELDAHTRRTQRIYDLDLHDPENRSRRAGAGYQYLRTVLQRMIAQNEQAHTWYERLYITPKQLEKQSGSNPQLVARFLRDCALQVQAHHEAMGWLTPQAGKSHNHKAGNHVRNLAREARKTARHEGAIYADVEEMFCGTENGTEKEETR